jgi:glutamate-ammonia-ligase adenylyltransferase
LVVVDAQPENDGNWVVSIVAYDFPGELSLICGLMFVYGLDILKGDAFTYEPEEVATGVQAVRGLPARPGSEPASSGSDPRRKLVDVFTVRLIKTEEGGEPSPGLWQRYAADLEELLEMMRAGQRSEARGMLAKRVGLAVGGAGSTGSDSGTALLPIGIEIDNDSSEHYTVLRIDAPDTAGFLYEFTTALSIHRIYIAQVLVSSIGNRVCDTIFVTDEAGRKITDPERLRELRAATVVLKHFSHLLPQSPNPESALLDYPEFIGQLFKRPNWPDELGSLERPEVLHALARLLGVSDFLWDDFLRMQYTHLYQVVTGVDALAAPKTRSHLQPELYALLA